MLGGKKKLIKKGTKFLMPEFDETDRTLENPCRGWYRMMTYRIEEEIKREELEWYTAFPLIFLLVDISAYSDRALDELAIGNLGVLMGIMRRLGKDIIFRFAYDTTGNGLEYEPKDFDLVLSHIDAVSKFLAKYDKHIFVFQGLFVGSWGEMHLSKFIDADRQLQMTKALRRYLPYTYLATRRPYYYRSIHKRVESDHKTGIFDDGILGSEDDLGTFGKENKNKVGWSRAWTKEEELEFISDLAEYAPIGGETVYPSVNDPDFALAVEDDDDPIPPGMTLSRLMKYFRRMKLSYLNRDYDTKLYDELEALTWDHDDAFYGCSGLYYLENHLGYRFYVDRVDVRIYSHDEIYKSVHFDIYIANSGFSKIYIRTKLRLAIREKRIPIDFEMADIEPGHIRRASFDVELEAGDRVHLELVRDNEEEDVISFANADKSGLVYLGELKQYD